MADVQGLIRIIHQIEERLLDLPTAQGAALRRDLESVFDAWPTTPPSIRDAKAQVRRVFTRHGMRPPSIVAVERSLGHVSFTTPSRQNDPGPTLSGPGLKALHDATRAFRAVPQPADPIDSPDQPAESAPLDAWVRMPAEALPEVDFDVRVWTAPAQIAAAAGLHAPIEDGHTQVTVRLDLPPDTALTCQSATTATLRAPVGQAAAPVVFALRGPAGPHAVRVLFMAGGRAALVTQTVHLTPDAQPATQEGTAPMPDTTSTHTLLVLQRGDERRALRFLLFTAGELVHEMPHTLTESARGLLSRTLNAAGDVFRDPQMTARRITNLGRAFTRGFLPDAMQAVLAALPPGEVLEIFNEAIAVPWPLLTLDGTALSARLVLTHRPLGRCLPRRLAGPVVAVRGARVQSTAPADPAPITAILTLCDRLDAAPIGLLHIDAHGTVERSDAEAPRWRLDLDGDFYTDDLQGPALQGACVIINACSAGGADARLQSISPWIEACLGAGAAAVLAPALHLPENVAHAFSAYLYENLPNETMPHAVQAAINSVRAKHPAAVAYTLYAHPAARWFPGG